MAEEQRRVDPFECRARVGREPGRPRDFRLEARRQAFGDRLAYRVDCLDQDLFVASGDDLNDEECGFAVLRRPRRARLRQRRLGDSRRAPPAIFAICSRSAGVSPPSREKTTMAATALRRGELVGELESAHRLGIAREEARRLVLLLRLERADQRSERGERDEPGGQHDELRAVARYKAGESGHGRLLYRLETKTRQHPERGVLIMTSARQTTSQSTSRSSPTRVRPSTRVRASPAARSTAG